MIHRYWCGPDGPPFEPWLAATIVGYHPDMTLVDWTPDTLPTYVGGLLDRADGQVRDWDRLRHRSNIVRLGLLAKFGGLWLDHDVVPLRDLTTISPRPWIAGSDQNQPSMAVMWFPDPHHPIIEKRLAEIARMPDDPNGHTPTVSGSLGWPPYGVRVEPAVQPINSDGTHSRVAAPAAVHLWVSSRQSASTRRPRGRL